MRGRRRSPLYWLLALRVLRQFSEIEDKGRVAVTLSLAAVNAAVFFLSPIPSEAVCLHPASIVAAAGAGGLAEPTARLLASAFHHASLGHLAMNMGSLLWKGCALERRMGGGAFAKLVALLLLLSHTLVVALSWAAFELAGASGLYGQCAVGFSAVLFGLKVVLQAEPDAAAVSHMWGVRLPGRYLCWAELLLVQLVAPGASFVGHLCGILAGLAFVHRAKAPPLAALATRAGIDTGLAGGRPRRDGAPRPWGPGGRSSHAAGELRGRAAGRGPLRWDAWARGALGSAWAAGLESTIGGSRANGASGFGAGEAERLQEAQRLQEVLIASRHSYASEQRQRHAPLLRHAAGGSSEAPCASARPGHIPGAPTATAAVAVPDAVVVASAPPPGPSQLDELRRRRVARLSEGAARYGVRRRSEEPARRCRGVSSWPPATG